MAVRTQCPRCKQPLAVPNKLAGSYANCPRCQGRFWISKDAPIDSSLSDSVSMSGGTLTLTQVPAGTTAPPVATPPPPRVTQQVAAPPIATAAADALASPRTYFPSVTPLAPLPEPEAASAAPPTPPPQARKVARLVTADTAQSNLKIAADGQLPNLQLQDVDEKQKGQGKSRSIPPLVLIGAWVLSVALTTVLLLFTAGGDSDTTTPEKAAAMKQIEDQYFGDPTHGPLLPYQRLLRDARQARARDDFKAERQYYKQVLDLLRTQPHSGGQSTSRLEKGVTGSRENDRDLEKKIITVLGD